MDFGSYDFFGNSSFGNMGSGFHGSSINYNDWSVSNYIRTPSTISVYAGSGWSDSVAYHPTWHSERPVAVASYNPTTDVISAFGVAGSAALTLGATATGAFVGPLSSFENIVIKTALGTPGIVANIVSFGQIAQGYIRHDAREVLTNTANLIGGFVGAEVPMWLLVV